MMSSFRSSSTSSSRAFTLTTVSVHRDKALPSRRYTVRIKQEELVRNGTHSVLLALECQKRLPIFHTADHSNFPILPSQRGRRQRPTLKDFSDVLLFSFFDALLLLLDSQSALPGSPCRS